MQSVTEKLNLLTGVKLTWTTVFGPGFEGLGVVWVGRCGRMQEDRMCEDTEARMRMTWFLRGTWKDTGYKILCMV